MNARKSTLVCNVVFAGAETACGINVRLRSCDGMYLPEDPMYTVLSRHKGHPVA
eukprot:COSAG02_NODE_4926_length_4827_cov_2.783418_7_plen_54_part_00